MLGLKDPAAVKRLLLNTLTVMVGMTLEKGRGKSFELGIMTTQNFYRKYQVEGDADVEEILSGLLDNGGALSAIEGSIRKLTSCPVKAGSMTLGPTAIAPPCYHASFNKQTSRFDFYLYWETKAWHRTACLGCAGDGKYAKRKENVRKFRDLFQ